MNKEERKNKALSHIEYMQDNYETDINESIKNSIIYRTYAFNYNPETNYIPKITIEDLTSEGAVYKYGGLHTALLNFASYKHPGGGFINGSMAQEEAICHASNLYNVIGSENFKKEYDQNNKELNSNLYNNFAIYSPNIIFERSNNSFTANVITCAAPNASAYINKVSKVKYLEDAYNSILQSTLESRIRFILNIAEKNQDKTLILGAFGCGVFGNDPIKVANIFKNLLYSGKYTFDKVIFAIPAGDNYLAFNSVFNNE